MFWVPHKGDWRRHSNIDGDNATLTPGTQVTTGGTNNINGTPAEIFAASALPFDAWYMRIAAYNYGGSNASSSGMLDILTGAATEDTLIPNLLIGGCGGIGVLAPGPKVWEFPIFVAAGTRISAAARGLRTSTNLRVTIEVMGGTGYPPFKVGSRVDTLIGAGTPPQGATITPGATGNIGAWAEVAASTSRDYFAFYPSFQVGADGSWGANVGYVVEMGLGAATEEVLGSGYIYTSATSETMAGPIVSGPMFKHVPAGSRLAMRASCSGTAESAYSCAIHAVY